MNKKNSIKGLLVAFLFLAAALQAFATDTISVAVREHFYKALQPPFDKLESHLSKGNQLASKQKIRRELS